MLTLNRKSLRASTLPCWVYPAYKSSGNLVSHVPSVHVSFPDTIKHKVNSVFRADRVPLLDSAHALEKASISVVAGCKRVAFFVCSGISPGLWQWSICGIIARSRRVRTLESSPSDWLGPLWPRCLPLPSNEDRKEKLERV